MRLVLDCFTPQRNSRFPRKNSQKALLCSFQPRLLVSLQRNSKLPIDDKFPFALHNVCGHRHKYQHLLFLGEQVAGKPQHEENRQKKIQETCTTSICQRSISTKHNVRRLQRVPSQSHCYVARPVSQSCTRFIQISTKCCPSTNLWMLPISSKLCQIFFSQPRRERIGLQAKLRFDPSQQPSPLVSLMDQLETGASKYVQSSLRIAAFIQEA